MVIPSLPEWDNFYVIAGSAAAGLTGLTFVVIALASDAQRVETTGVHTFVTPTIVHFSAVLALAAFMCVPHQTFVSAALGCGALGLAGLLYMMRIAFQMRYRVAGYTPVAEDWIWNACLPFISYGVLLGMAGLTWRRSDSSLYGVAASSMLLLFSGIHNAWDIGVWMTVRKAAAAEAKADPPPPA